MDEIDWVSAYIFYQDTLDPVLVHFVDPVVQDLTAEGLASAYFFIRYWDGGDHLRLHLLTGPAGREAVRRRVGERGAQFLRAHPSPDLGSADDYPQWAAELARLENGKDYRRRPYPNNSLVFAPYRREYRWLGDSAPIEALEQHFVESSQIALALVKAGLTAGQRDTVALSILYLSWFINPVNIEVVARMLPEIPHRPEREESYRRQRDTVLGLAHRMRARASEPHQSGRGALAAWTRSVARLRDALAGSAGPVHIHRVLDICAHLTANRLGVPMVEERHLRYLAGATIRAMARGTRARL